MPIRANHDDTDSPAQLDESASVAEKLEASLPQVDINLVSDGQDADHQPQPLTRELRKALRPPRSRSTEPSSRRRRRSGSQEPIELDQDFISNPARMNYALLLALLLRNRGSVMLSAAELNINDSDHNIVYALSDCGTRLEISVVSKDSGIIRSPEAKWAPHDQVPQYQAPPLPPAADDLNANQLALETLQSLHSGAPPQVSRIVAMPQQMPRSMAPPSPFQQPNPKPGDAAGSPAPYVFPFETGTSPTTAQPNLQALQSELAKDRSIALEEQRAAAKVEAAGSA